MKRLLIISLVFVFAGCEDMITLNVTEQTVVNEADSAQRINARVELEDTTPESTHPDVVYEADVLASEPSIPSDILLDVTEWLSDGGRDPAFIDGVFIVILEYESGRTYNLVEIITL